MHLPCIFPPCTSPAPPLQAAEKGLALAVKVGLAADDPLHKSLIASKTDFVKALTDPKLAKKAAPVYEGGAGRSRRGSSAQQELCLSQTPPVLESLLSAKSEAAAVCADASSALFLMARRRALTPGETEARSKGEM